MSNACGLWPPAVHQDRRRACMMRATGRSEAKDGLGLGAALWLTADEIAMPTMRLSESTLERPFEMHMQSFASHLAYGVATERVRRAIVNGREDPYVL